MALMLGDRALYRLSVDDVYRMLQSGVLTEDTPVELLEGVLVDVSPKSPQHTDVLMRLVRWLLPLMAAGRHDIRTEQPLAVPDPTSLPEPDVAVVERPDDPTSHPTTALLVIEVAVSSRATDTTVKPALYATARVPDYWVVDVPNRRIEVRREPVEGEYRRVEIIGGGQQIAPLELDVEPVTVSTLFPAP